MKSLHHLFITDELADVSNQPSLGRGQGTHSSSLIAAGGTGHEVARLTFRLVTLLVSIKRRKGPPAFPWGERGAERGHPRFLGRKGAKRATHVSLGPESGWRKGPFTFPL